MPRSPEPDRPRTFGGDFRVFFIKGLAILLPSVLTLWIVVQLFLFVQTRVAEPINVGIRFAVIQLAPKILPASQQPEWFVVTDEQVQRLKDERARLAQRPVPEAVLRAQIRERNLKEFWDEHWYLRGIGLLVAVVLIYLAGRFLGGYIGRRVYGRLERFFARLPVVKQVYPHVKQVVEFLFGERDRIKFNRVVLVEYPRRGIWTVGLMTGDSMRAIEGVARHECVTVFIPSSPTPFTGYTITVKREDALDLPITVEEALRFVVTGGVLVPESQTPTAEDRRRLAESARGAKMGDGSAGAGRAAG
ncbi:MAG: DUF502 domain-containing protein [Planctomycetota bacterium]|nr:MAG: DUF502 domain-containing protein [Planctomycetota bacterium]